jgi:hypothetical protein
MCSASVKLAYAPNREYGAKSSQKEIFSKTCGSVVAQKVELKTSTWTNQIVLQNQGVLPTLQYISFREVYIPIKISSLVKIQVLHMNQTNLDHHCQNHRP